MASDWLCAMAGPPAARMTRPPSRGIKGRG
jgi:hypothetical protein